MLTGSREVVRPDSLKNEPRIKIVDNPKDLTTQAMYDLLYVAEQRIGSLDSHATPGTVALELSMLTKGIVKSKERGKGREEFSEYFASFFKNIPIRSKDVSETELSEYKASGMCFSVNGYYVWFAKDHGQLCLYFRKVPVVML